jgi:Zn-dependent protease with chaperone function
MDISTFLNTSAGMYVVQSFCHSVVAAVLVDRALKAWKIYDPLARQRFRLIVILFPIFSFPLYQLFNPARSSVLFRMEALFDSSRWLTLEIGWGVPLSVLFLFMLGATSLVFIFQELIPVLRHTLTSRHSADEGTHFDADTFVQNAAKVLSIRKPAVILIDEDEPFLFSTTGREAFIYLSSGLTRTLSSDELQASIAHEIAHIARSRRPLLIALFLFRIVQFFNPIVLVKYRKAVRDEEKICDDIAASLTGNRRALAAALKNFYQKPDKKHMLSSQQSSPVNMSLEEYSHNLHLESRIIRLEAEEAGPEPGRIVPFVLTLSAVILLNYLIV